jgi:hypothetical protein
MTLPELLEAGFSDLVFTGRRTNNFNNKTRED